MTDPLRFKKSEDEPALTDAGRTYLINAHRFVELVEAVSRGTGEKLATLAALTGPGPAASTSRTDRPREGQMEGAGTFINLWYVVMLVTFAEAFLHDALAECAAADPTIMSNSEQRATYSEIKSMGSLDTVMQELRSRWARNFVDDGGPRRWCDRLSRMGIATFPDALAPQLEEAWGLRHMVVHRAGAVTADFASRHPIFAARPGEQLQVPMYLVFEYAQAIGQFVKLSDRGIGMRTAAASRSG